MRATRVGCSFWILPALFAVAGGCGLDVSGIGGDVGVDPGPDGFDAEVPPPDDSGDDDAGPTTCTTAAQCDDGIACTVDTCPPETGTCAHTPDDAACDDHDVCTGVERCDPARGCVSDAPVVCDDGVGCTDDLCDPATGACGQTLVHERCTPPQLCDPPRSPDATGCADPPSCEIDADCSDGDRCNGEETCGPDRRCRPGIPVDCDDGVPCTVDACAPATGACTHTAPDADGDTFPDAACFGTDCNDAIREVHPGATESCNGRDDDCDASVDNGAACPPVPHAAAQCVGGACRPSCEAGWGDCDVDPANGCEASLSDPATCGSCTTPCNPPHAVATCTGGVCGIASCDSAWGNCNGTTGDGCERSLTTLTDCGNCSVPCNPVHATGATCADGTCRYTGCESGWLDCDEQTESGCETPAGGSATACRVSCTNVVNCAALPNVSSEARPVSLDT